MREADAAAARSSLAEFFRAGWHVLEAATPLVWNWHIDAVCEHVQVLFQDWIEKQKNPAYLQRIQNLLVNIPPGTAKSRIVSVYAPAWMWIHWPEWRAIFLASNPRVALRDSMLCRELIESRWYRHTFRPDWHLADDQNAKSLFRNTRGGFRQALGITAKITGDRGDFLGIDDPHDAEEAQSEVKRLGVTERYKTAIANRVNDLRCSTRLGIMQRVHDADWSGCVLKEGVWEHLCIAQEFEPSTSKTTCIGWKDPRTTEGELLFPAMFPADVLKRERERLGSTGYACQHQQRPVPAEGGRFKKQWFRYWEFADDGGDLVKLIRGDGDYSLVELGKCRFFATQDVADSVKKSADYTVITTWAVTPMGDLLLLDRIRDRMEDPTAIQEVVNLFEAWHTHGHPLGYIATEENGVGLPRIQHLRAKGIPVKGIKVHQDKFSRSATAVVRSEAGKIFWPDPKRTPWLIEWETEHLLFPNGEHDDQVDTTSIAAIEVFQPGSFLRPTEETVKIERTNAVARMSDSQSEAESRHTSSLKPDPSRGLGGRRTGRRMFGR